MNTTIHLKQVNLTFISIVLNTIFSLEAEIFRHVYVKCPALSEIKISGFEQENPLELAKKMTAVNKRFSNFLLPAFSPVLQAGNELLNVARKPCSKFC